MHNDDAQGRHDRIERERMRADLSKIYACLCSVRMQEHARDFWRIRASRQKKQVDSDALLHEHTALTQYMLWHDINGVRLPSFQRGTCVCLKHTLYCKT